MITRRAALLAAAGILAFAGSIRADDTNMTPKSAWETSTSLGLTITRGNSDTLLFTALILAEQKKEKHELRLGADAAYGENDDVKSAESYHGFAQYNHLFTDRFYAYARADGLHDGIADVDYRFTLGPGAGYYFVKSKGTSLSGEGGPSVVFERQGGVERTYPALRIAEKFEHKVNDHVRIWQNLEYLPNWNDSFQYVMNAEVGVESGLTKKASLRVYVQDTYYSRPASGRENNDAKLVSALAWKF